VVESLSSWTPTLRESGGSRPQDPHRIAVTDVKARFASIVG